MSHDILLSVPRNERRRLLSAEAKARSSGEWGAWEKMTFPRGSCGRKWAAEFTVAHRNKVFSVLDRTTECGVRHLAITSLSQIRPTWPEMQRIKNELAGNDATAVEVFPPQHEVVDAADMYHLWVLTSPLPFGIYEDGAT